MSEMSFWRWVQYEFDRQWQQVVAHAHKCGILIIGDMPIYVAHDSMDVWAAPEQFLLDENYPFSSPMFRDNQVENPEIYMPANAPKTPNAAMGKQIRHSICFLKVYMIYLFFIDLSISINSIFDILLILYLLSVIIFYKFKCFFFTF